MSPKSIATKTIIVWTAVVILIVLLFMPAPGGDPEIVQLGGDAGDGGVLLAGAGAVDITPFTREGHPASNADPDWNGGVTASGLWGEPYEDTNSNGRWDPGEPWQDDERNTALDSSAGGTWNGIWMAGYGSNRQATGVLDSIWARTLFLEGSGTSMAWVVLDFQGYFSHHLEEVRRYLARDYPDVEVDEIIISSTHNHEGPDTFGMWGPDEFTDGKYPLYLDYVNRKIAQSIAEACRELQPVSVRWGSVTPEEYPEIAGMMGRNSARPPWFFDEELRVMQLNARNGTVATLTNWSAHPESLDSKNTMLSSDYPAALRSFLEERYGGVALHTVGPLSASEIVGDSSTRVADRDTFDGETFPVDPETGEPLEFSAERTYAIGRTVAKAAAYALEHGETDPTATGLTLRYRDLYVPLTNQALRILAVVGVLDLPGYFADRWQMPPWASTTVKTRVYFWQIGQGSFITAPGELFPEIWYGLPEHARSDWEETTTGRPFEPAVRPAQPGDYKFFIGLTPDQLGYIVPAYDYYIYGVPVITGVGVGVLMGEVPDPNAEMEREYVSGKPLLRFEKHYQETNGASSMLAAAVTVTQMELMGHDVSDEAAYREWRRYKSALLRVHNPFQDLSLSLDPVRHK